MHPISVFLSTSQIFFNCPKTDTAAANECAHGKDIYQLMTEHHVSLIHTTEDAIEYLKTIKAPECKDLFITTVDGMHRHASHRVTNKNAFSFVCTINVENYDLHISTVSLNFKSANTT